MSISTYASFWLGINSAFGFWQLKDRNKFNLATTNVSSNEEKGYTWYFEITMSSSPTPPNTFIHQTL